MPREPQDILGDQEVGLLTALVNMIPTIGRFLAGLAAGDPAAKRRVADILPERSASADAGAELRSRRRGG